MNRLLSLTTPEWDALRELLETGARQLSLEIRHTAVRRYRDRLLARQEVLTRLLQRMQNDAGDEHEGEPAYPRPERSGGAATNS